MQLTATLTLIPTFLASRVNFAEQQDRLDEASTVATTWELRRTQGELKEAKDELKTLKQETTLREIITVIITL